MHAQLRGLIEQYVHMHLRLHDFNVWLNLPSGEERQLSQRWHRDEPDDRHILKAFIYLRDVPDGAGPLAYVRGSHREAVRKAQLPATWDGYGFRVEDDVIEQRLRRRADDLDPRSGGHHRGHRHHGYHRGGWAVDQERLVMMALYASRTSRKRRLIRPGPGIDPAEWSGEVAFLDTPTDRGPHRPPRVFTQAKQTGNLTSVRSPPWLRWHSSGGPTRPQRVSRCERPAGRGCCCSSAASRRPTRWTSWRTGSGCRCPTPTCGPAIDWLTRRLAPPGEPEVPVLDEDGLLHSGGRWVSLPPVEARLAQRHARALRRGRQPRRAGPGRVAPGRAGPQRARRPRAAPPPPAGPVGLAIRTVRSRGYLLERAEPSDLELRNG